MRAALHEHIRRLVEAIPEGGAVTLPVSILRQWLTEDSTTIQSGPARPAASSDMPDPGFRVAEVADRVGRDASTVRGWIAEGRFPGARKLSGREWRIPRADLEAFIRGPEEDSSDSAQWKSPELTAGGDLGAWRRRRGNRG